MNILVTGGAGYIGSHAVRVLERAGHDVWVYDNLVYGHREAARPDRLIVGDLLETERLTLRAPVHADFSPWTCLRPAQS